MFVMRAILIVAFFLVSSLVFGQQKTENVFIITLDGFRWQELYTGADSALVGNKDYARNPEELRSRFWKPTPEQRRETLMPFFWNTIARQGQLYGNRKHGHMVTCSNKMVFSYP